MYQPGMMQGGMPMQGMPMQGMPMQGMPMGMMPGMMPGMMGQQPIFKQIEVGQGIDMNEFNKIVTIATNVYMMGQRPFSTQTANALKMQIRGEWLVICYPASKMYDFCLSCVKGGDYMSFSLNDILFKVCRLK